MKFKIKAVEVEIAHFSQSNFDTVQNTIQKGLATKAKKNRDVIKEAFSLAVQLAPNANPSDLWHHVVYRL